MKSKCIAFSIIYLYFLCGCASYRDINNTNFTTVTVIDVDEEGNPVVYVECFFTYYSQLNADERGYRAVLVGRGETISEAIQKINQTSRQENSSVYSKMVVFTKKAAEHGLEEYMDFLIRDQEALLRPYVVIFDGEPTELLNIDLKQGDYVGLYLEQLFASDAVSNIMHPFKLFEYVNMMNCKSKLSVMSIIGVDENEVDPYIGIKEAAVIKDDKMLDTLTEDEYKTYCLLNGMSKTTLITVNNPKDDKAKVTIIAQSNKVKKNIEYDGKSENLIHYKVELKLTLIFEETQKPIDLEDDQIRKAIEAEVEEKIKKEGIALFEKYQLKDIDLFSVEEQLYRKYPQYDITNVVSNTDFEIVIKTHLEGSPDVQNYND